MNDTITQSPRPPSLADSYRSFIASGMTAVFEDFDTQMKAWSDKQKVAAAAQPSTGGAPMYPGTGPTSLLTPRQRASNTTAAQIASQEQRMGWRRVWGLNLAQTTSDGDGWPIAFGRLTQSGELLSPYLVEFQFSVPPVDTPYTTTNGVRRYNYSGWPIPAYWRAKSDDIGQLSMLSPNMSIHLMPALNDGMILQQRFIVSHAPRPRPTPPSVAPGSIAAGSLDRWSIVTWLQDNESRPVQLSHAFAEIV